MNRPVIILLFQLASAIVCAQNLPAVYDSIDLNYNDNFQGFRLLDTIKAKAFIVAEDEHNRINVPAATLKFLRYLYQNKGIRTLCIEGGASTAHLINQYLAHGDTVLLREIIRHTFFWSKEHHEFFRTLYQWNQSLPNAERISIQSADIELKQESVILAVNEMLKNKTIPKSLSELENFIRIYNSKAAHRSQFQALNVYYYYDKEECKKLTAQMLRELSSHADLYQNFFGQDFPLFKKMITDMRTLYEFNYKKESRFMFRDEIIYSKLLELQTLHPEGFLYVVGAKHTRPGSSSNRLKHDSLSLWKDKVILINTVARNRKGKYEGARAVTTFVNQLSPSYKNATNLFILNPKGSIYFDMTLAFGNKAHVTPFQKTFRGN
jgi:hypothetical protein